MAEGRDHYSNKGEEVWLNTDAHKFRGGTSGNLREFIPEKIRSVCILTIYTYIHFKYHL